MADNITLNPGLGGNSLAADEISGVYHQRVKIQHGADGSAVDASGDNPLPVTLANALSVSFPLDAFGRLRVSEPRTLFDSKQLNDAQPYDWDDVEVSGGGTGSTHDPDRASSALSVSNTTAGRRVRQTKRRFNYQPGKSTYIFMTAIMGNQGAGLIGRMGLYDDQNGIFAQTAEGVLGVGIRSYVTGSAVDNVIAQSSWNGDKLDGTGDSGVTLDPTKAQIFWIDMEWLGVGSVRCGFVIDGVPILCHTFHHANSVSSVYMSSPNLPIRYELVNDGTGAAATLEAICSTVMVEGGPGRPGQRRYADTYGSTINLTNADGLQAIMGVRLQAARLDEQIELIAATIFNDADEKTRWVLLLNPTVDGTFNYTDVTGTSLQRAIGDGNANTVTGGVAVAGGLVAGSNDGTADKEAMEDVVLGSKIDGTPDELVLCAVNLNTTGNANFLGGLTWKELG